MIIIGDWWSKKKHNWLNNLLIDIVYIIIKQIKMIYYHVIGSPEMTVTASIPRYPLQNSFVFSTYPPPQCESSNPS